MKIVKIDWMNDEILEGILIVNSGEFTFQVFSHPCPYKVDDEIKKRLISLDEDHIVRVDEATSPMIKQVGTTFRHDIIARVENVSGSLVSVADVMIELGSFLPGDIVEGDFVSFQSWRLSL